MQDLSIFLPQPTKIVGILGLLAPWIIAAVAVFNYLKDRPIIEASSQIEAKCVVNREGRMIEIPALKIKVVNSGKRPVQLLHLVKVFPKGSSISETKTILNDYPGEQEMTSLDRDFEDLIKKSLEYDSGEDYPKLVIDERGKEIIERYAELQSKRDRKFKHWSDQSQNHAYHLEAGKIFEKRFELPPPDNYAFLYYVDAENFATDLMVEDVRGKKYRVKNSKQCLDKLRNW